MGFSRRFCQLPSHFYHHLHQYHPSIINIISLFDHCDSGHPVWVFQGAYLQLPSQDVERQSRGARYQISISLRQHALEVKNESIRIVTVYFLKRGRNKGCTSQDGLGQFSVFIIMVSCRVLSQMLKMTKTKT